MCSRILTFLLFCCLSGAVAFADEGSAASRHAVEGGASGGSVAAVVDAGQGGGSNGYQSPPRTPVAYAFAVHLYLAAELPIEYGLLIWEFGNEQRPYHEAWMADRGYQVGSFGPYDLAGYVVSEHSWKYKDFSIEGALARPKGKIDYEPTALGDGDEQGIAQIKPSWVKKARNKCKKEGWGACDELRLGDTETRAGGMFEPRVNLRVAAYVVRKAHESHAKEGLPSDAEAKRCKRKIKRALKHRKLGEDPKDWPIPTCDAAVYHDWYAHLKLGSARRDFMCDRPGFKKRKLRKVLASLKSLGTPAKVWKQAKEEFHDHCI